MEPNIIIAVVFFLIALALLLHHGIKHSMDPPDSNARRESFWCVCYFQLKDISHWESWSIICLTNSLSMGILAPLSVGMESTMSDVHTLFALELFIVGLILLNIGSVWHLFAESPAECRNGGGLKVHNVCNHETWIFVAFTNGLSFWALLK